jgi:hypothetical protein
MSAPIAVAPAVAKADDATQVAERPVVLLPVVWSIIAEPLVPVEGTDQQIHLACELLFTNVTSASAQFLAIEAVGSLAEVQDALLSGGGVLPDDTDTGPRRRQMPLTSDLLDFH